MDRIVALYGNTELALQVRVGLTMDDFATDRVDVVSWDQTGRAVNDPTRDREGNLAAYFTTLLGNSDSSMVDLVVKALRQGKAAVVVHPRGTVEIQSAREILESHNPETVFWRVAPLETQGGLLGEHAAGG